MLFTIIGNIIALGAVGALVAAVIKRDRDAAPEVQEHETQVTTAGSAS